MLPFGVTVLLTSPVLLLGVLVHSQSSADIGLFQEELLGNQHTITASYSTSSTFSRLHDTEQPMLGTDTADYMNIPIEGKDLNLPGSITVDRLSGLIPDTSEYQSSVVNGDHPEDSESDENIDTEPDSDVQESEESLGEQDLVPQHHDDQEDGASPTVSFDQLGCEQDDSAGARPGVTNNSISDTDAQDYIVEIMKRTMNHVLPRDSADPIHISSGRTKQQLANMITKIQAKHTLTRAAVMDILSLFKYCFPDINLPNPNRHVRLQLEN